MTFKMVKVQAGDIRPFDLGNNADIFGFTGQIDHIEAGYHQVTEAGFLRVTLLTVSRKVDNPLGAEHPRITVPDIRHVVEVPYDLDIEIERWV